MKNLKEKIKKEFSEDDIKVLCFLIFNKIKLNVTENNDELRKLKDINKFVNPFLIVINKEKIIIHQNTLKNKLFWINIDNKNKIKNYFEIIIQKDCASTYGEIISLFKDKTNINNILNNYTIKIYAIKNNDQNLIKFLETRRNFKDIFVNNNEDMKLFFNMQNKDFYNDFNDSKLVNNNYLTSSFNKLDNYGLTSSQLKTLLGFFALKEKSNFLSINGGPGTGKSTLLNYIISNYLMNHLLEFKEKSNTNLNIFITNYECPRILMTGSTKNAVNNLVDVCKIYPSERHKWINFDDEIFLYNFDFSLIKDEENKLDVLTLNKFKSLSKFFDNINEFEEEYVSNATKYFKNINIIFSNILENIFDAIDKNNKDINDIFQTIQYLKESSSKSLNEKKKYEDYSKYCIYLNEFKKINKKSKKRDMIKDVKNILELFDDMNDSILSFIVSESKYLRFRRFFYSRKKLYRKITLIFKENIKDFSGELTNLNKLIIEWNSFPFIKSNQEFNLKEIILNNKVFNEILSFNFEIKRIEIDIQAKLDTTIRKENSFLFRHIFEWKFINLINEKYNKNIQCNCKYKNGMKLHFRCFKFFNILRTINPIISSNIQGIDFNKVTEKYYDLWKLKKQPNFPFDLIIIDEASQTDSKYSIPLSMLGKNILAIGDEKQLQPINVEKQDINFMSSFFSIINDNKDYVEKFIEVNNSVNNFVSATSLLSLINENSKIKANIYETNDAIENINEDKGFYLLEHFRCPEKIFNVINEHFYNETLVFVSDNSAKSCSLSKKYNSPCCNDISFIEIGHNYIADDKNKTNIKEVEIGFKYIIESYLLIYEHCYGEKPNNLNLQDILKKLINKVAFVTFYKNQAKEIIKFVNNSQINKIVKNEEDTEYWISFLKKIKQGTVDSLQGIGCEFIIFSNVSDGYTYEDSEIQRAFEFDDKRINVLWTRTKSHFIHIRSNKYWNKFNTDKDNKSNKAALKARINAEISLNIGRLSLQEKNFDFDLNENQIKDNRKITGRNGESLFNTILKEPYLKYIFIEKINEKLKENISVFDNYKWNNNEKETYENHDFSIQHNNSNIYLEVKTNKSKKTNLWMSNNEFDFAKQNEENWALIHLLEISSLSNLNYIDLSIKHFIINKMTINLINEIEKSNNKDKKRFEIKIK